MKKEQGRILIKAQIKYFLEDNEEALEIIETKDEQAIFYQLKVVILFELGKYNEALEFCEEAIRFDPKELLNYNYKAINLAKVGKKEEAIELIERLIRYKDNEALFYQTYGGILMNFDEFITAIDKFQTALGKLENGDSEHPGIEEETYIQIGKCYLKVKQLDKAKDYLIRGKKLAEEKNNRLWRDKATKYILKLEEYD